MPEADNDKLRDLFLSHSVGLDRLVAGEVEAMGNLLVDAEREMATVLRQRLRAISLGKVELSGTGADTTRRADRSFRALRPVSTRPVSSDSA